LYCFFNSAFAQLKAVKYTDGKIKWIVNCSKKEAKTKPGILILPLWRSTHSKQSAEKLSTMELLYCDIYGEGNYQQTRKKLENKLVLQK
jgi:hypothetical protein